MQPENKGRVNYLSTAHGVVNSKLRWGWEIKFTYRL